MADIRAFRGFRYDLGRVGALSDVVAPPYDVIDNQLQQTLYDRSPYNVIRLELTKDESGDSETNNRYTRAAQTLSSWQIDHILVQDTLRNLYICEQEFTVEGRTYIRRGFFARVRLEPFGKGQIYPHEETMSGPKADRLKLFQATGMNISPVFGLYPDPENEVYSKLESYTIRNLPLQATDHLGVISRVWPVTDEKILSAVVGMMSAKPIFIADGHHRYETGLKYLEEQKASGMVPSEDAPANFIMMMLVSMSDPGLIILPTHRLVSGLPDMTGDQLRVSLEPYFHFETVGKGEKAGEEVWEMIQADGGQDVLGFHTNADDQWQMVRFVASDRMEQHEPDRSAEWRDLGVSVLHVMVLNRLLPDSVGGHPKCRYVHQLQEVQESIAAKECQLAVLVPPATMTHVEQIAGNLEKMPPKSTYFYPKLLTGLVFNSLKVN